jgi:hypothetical protein
VIYRWPHKTPKAQALSRPVAFLVRLHALMLDSNIHALIRQSFESLPKAHYDLHK